jgi:DNA-binding PadR family transcriptional regulator
MGKGNYLGEFEQMVMLALVRVGEAAYSVPVHEEIQRTTGRDVAIASVYVTLSRLQDKGLVSSESEPRGEATGRPRRFYAPTDAGWASLQRSREMIDAMWAGVHAPEAK